jgi:hypothetical protein
MNGSFILYILNALLTTQSLNFCKNCKFYRSRIEKTGEKTLGKCTYFQIVYKETYNLISGELIESSSDYEFCGKARLYENLCGASGKFYSSKNNDSSSKNLKTICDL